MNWLLALLLSTVGILFGIAALFGLTGWGEWLLWLIGGIPCGIQLARNVQERLFLHGFIAGGVGGFLSGLLRIIFFTTYAENNREAIAPFKDVGTLGAQSMLIVETTGMSLLTGLLFGVLAAFAGRFFTPPEESGVLIPNPPDHKDPGQQTPPSSPPQQ
jgi:hypothetical protein